MRASNNDPHAYFGRLIRQAIDEVLDGPRTGRFMCAELTTGEKTYIGTKVEIIIQNELDMPRGSDLDLSINGIEVDIKWSQESIWMIPLEYDDVQRYPAHPICLFLGTHTLDSLRFNVGVGRAELTTAGRNRDGKGSLRATALDSRANTTTLWLVRNGTLPSNFFSTLPQNAMARIMTKPKGQARVNQLLEETLGNVVPREAIEAVAQQKDAMRRIREDLSLPIHKRKEILILSGTWEGDRAAAAHLGINLTRDYIVPIRRSDLLSLPPEVRDRIKGR